MATTLTDNQIEQLAATTLIAVALRYSDCTEQQIINQAQKMVNFALENATQLNPNNPTQETETPKTAPKKLINNLQEHIDKTPTETKPTPDNTQTTEKPQPPKQQQLEINNAQFDQTTIQTGPDLLELGEKLGINKQETINQTINLLGPLTKGTSRTPEELQSVAQILIHIKKNGPIETQTFGKKVDSFEEAYNDVPLDWNTMTNTLQNLGAEPEDITKAAEFLPPTQNPTERTHLQTQAVYIKTLKTLEAELNKTQ